MARLVAWHWPGNVRELRNIVERLVATADDDVIRIDHLPPEIRGGTPLPHPDGADALPVPQTAEELKQAKQRLKQVAWDRVEKRFVLGALERSAWNVTRAAQLVGMQRPNFHALMRRFGIRARDADGA